MNPEYFAEQILNRSQTPAPVTLEIYPTLRCNLDCQFCDTTDRHRPPQAEKSKEEWLEILQSFADNGTKQIFILGGGEPFVYPHLIDLMYFVKNKGLWGMLTTNATLFTPQKRSALVEMQWDELHISLDGATAETHDTLRGKRGTFRKVIQNVCAIRALKQKHASLLPKLVFHWVITNQNVHELPDVIQLASTLGIERIDFDRLIAYTPEQHALQLDEKTYNLFLDKATEALALAHKLSMQTNLEQHLQREERGSTLPQNGTERGILGAPCYKPWHHLTIQANGRTSPCCVLAGEGSEISIDNPLLFWRNDPYFTQMRQAMEQHTPPKRCQECSSNILEHERQIQKALLKRSTSC